MKSKEPSKLIFWANTEDQECVIKYYIMVMHAHLCKLINLFYHYGVLESLENMSPEDFEPYRKKSTFSTTCRRERMFAN